MMGPLMLIVIGVLFLLNNLFPYEFRFGRMWPVILIVIGVVKVIEYFQSEGKSGISPDLHANPPSKPGEEHK
jgi:hypothetical protein